MTHMQPEGTRSGPRVTEPDMFPEPYPWCLACGFQHDYSECCAECTGDHSRGFCMTPEVAAELDRYGLELPR